jgi:very-short-patch-repair endonuclease
MKEYYEKIIKESFSRADVCKKLGIPSNGKGGRKVVEISKQYNIDITHFKLGGSKNRKYKIIDKECPVCKKVFKTEFGHKKEKITCSVGCHNTYRGNRSQKTKDKIKKTLKNTLRKGGIILLTDLPKRQCEFCKKMFKPKSKKRRFCSSICSKKATPLNPSYIEKQRKLALQRVEDGTHVGWKSRTKFKDSYPEAFFRKVLNENNIQFEKDYRQGRWFIDFAILDKKIALEIDGKQHLEKDRQECDRRKDEHLISQDWLVYRIPWKNPTNDKNKLYIKNEIDKFLNIYNSR